jgi:hypothetical protein
VLLVLLGIWGGLIPLVGPYVNYAYTPDHAWTLNSGRIWLEILPAAGTVLGGLILLSSKLRPMALTGGCLAAASGAWFAVGSALAPLWTSSTPAQGYPVGSHIAKIMEQVSFFTGLGVVIVCVAALALGRLSVVTVRDAAAGRSAVDAAAAAEAETAPHDVPPFDTAPTPAASSTATTRRWPAAATARMRRVASSDKTDSSEPVGSSARP